MLQPIPSQPEKPERPRDEGRLLDVELPLDTLNRVLDLPVPYEQESGVVSRMRRTKAFRGYFHASTMLGQLGEKSKKSVFDMSLFMGSLGILELAEEAAEGDPNVTADLGMRIRLTKALAPITARTREIADTRLEPRTVAAHEALFFTDAYEGLAGLGYELLDKFRAPKTSREAADYTGFAHELTFHLMNYRKIDALRFSTQASVYDDYFSKTTRFDVTAHNLKPELERHVRAQIKAQRLDFHTDPDDDVKMIYGKQDMFNFARHAFWENTPQADSPFPTLTALLDEEAGIPTDSERLDEIAVRLHSRLFS